MSDSTLDTLTQRLDRLERKVLWWRCFAIVLSAVVSVVVLAAATATKPAAIVDVVRARRVEVVDDEGQTRIELGQLVDEWDGETIGLALEDAGGKRAASLSMYSLLTAQHVRLRLNDGAGRPRASLRTHWSPESDVSELTLFGRYLGGPTNQWLDASEEVISLKVDSLRIPLRSEGISPSTASLSIRTGKVGANVWSDGKDESISLNLNNFAGPPIVGVPEKGTLSLAMEHGFPSIRLGDGRGGLPGLVLGATTLRQSRSGIEERRPSSSLVLFDKEGAVMWKAP